MYCCKIFKKLVNEDVFMGLFGRWIIPNQKPIHIKYCPFCGKDLDEYQQPR